MIRQFAEMIVTIILGFVVWGCIMLGVVGIVYFITNIINWIR